MSSEHESTGSIKPLVLLALSSENRTSQLETPARLGWSLI
jgi:hypothetical protein